VFESLVEIGRVGGQARHVVGCPEPADQACGVPGGSAGEGVAFQQDHVGPTKFRQVEGDAGTDDAAADDHDLRSFRDLSGHCCLTGPRGGMNTPLVVMKLSDYVTVSNTSDVLHVPTGTRPIDAWAGVPGPGRFPSGIWFAGL